MMFGLFILMTAIVTDSFDVAQSPTIGLHLKFNNKFGVYGKYFLAFPHQFIYFYFEGSMK